MLKVLVYNYILIYLYQNVLITHYVFLVRFKIHHDDTLNRDRCRADHFGGYVREHVSLWIPTAPQSYPTIY